MAAPWALVVAAIPNRCAISPSGAGGWVTGVILPVLTPDEDEDPAAGEWQQPASPTEWHSVQIKERSEGVFHAPCLLGGEVPDELAEATRVDGTDLLHQHPGHLAGDVHRGSEGGGPCARGCRSHEDDAPRQHGVGLDDDAVAPGVLFVAGVPG